MSEFTSLLPPNATPELRALEQVMAEPKMDMQLPIAALWDVDRCPVELLPWLAWSMSVDVWEPTWTEQQKRDVIRNSIQIHRFKGTRWSVQKALSALGFRTEIAEWFEYGGAPHTFRVTAFGEDVFDAGFQPNQELADTIHRILRNVKPARSRYDLRLGQTLTFSASLRVACGVGQRIRDRVAPSFPTRESFFSPKIRTGLHVAQRLQDEAKPVAEARRVHVTPKIRVLVNARQVLRDLTVLKINPEAPYVA